MHERQKHPTALLLLLLLLGGCTGPATRPEVPVLNWEPAEVAEEAQPFWKPLADGGESWSGWKTVEEMARPALSWKLAEELTESQLVWKPLEPEELPRPDEEETMAEEDSPEPEPADTPQDLLEVEEHPQDEPEAEEETVPEEPGPEAAGPSLERKEEDNPVETAPSMLPRRTRRVRELREENGDTVGWLKVPGTSIDHVIVHNPVEDMHYYITHDFYGNPDPRGAYSADFRITFPGGPGEKLAPNTTLYGHNFTEDPNGVLFDQLKRFKDPAFAREHPYLFFSTQWEDMAWEIFAVYDAHVDLPYISPYLTWEKFRQTLDVVSRASLYDYGISIEPEDRVLTLSCCTYTVPGVGDLPLDVSNDYRFVVMARLVAPESPLKERAELVERTDILAPDDMPFIGLTWEELYRRTPAY